MYREKEARKTILCEKLFLLFFLTKYPFIFIFYKFLETLFHLNFYFFFFQLNTLSLSVLYDFCISFLICGSNFKICKRTLKHILVKLFHLPLFV